MNYQEMNALKKGERLTVNDGFGWKKGTFMGFISGADAAAWIAFDERQKAPGNAICTKVYTGLQFTEEYWNQDCKGKMFERISEDELNAELPQNMEVAQ